MLKLSSNVNEWKPLFGGGVGGSGVKRAGEGSGPNWVQQQRAKRNA
jgi:hypothetical protein